MPTKIAPIVWMTPLLMFGLYRRYRSTFGAQRVRPGLAWLRVVMLSLSSLLLLTLFWVKFAAALGVVAGLLAGAALGEWGLRRATFERRADATWYTPDRTIGLGLTALFLGRLVFRAATYGQADPADPLAQLSPATMVVVGLLLGYYLRFTVGVLMRSRALAPPASA